MLIQAPHFTAGYAYDRGVVTQAAPIISYMVGWSLDRVQAYADKKGWKIVEGSYRVGSDSQLSNRGDQPGRSVTL